jgi:hypothetical protein
VKTILRLVGVVLAVIAVLHFVNRGATEKRAEIRVQTMMDGWLAGGTSYDGHAQEAVCMWFNGRKSPPDGKTLGAASDAFDQWRRAKNLYRKIRSYTIERVENPDKSSTDVNHVYIQIDGKPYAMKVERHRPIEWL